MTVVDRVHTAYARLEEVDRPEIWITIRSIEHVLAEAENIDARLAAGEALPLAGTLVAVKDNIDVAGLETTAGCPAFAYQPVASATAVRRLQDAGAIVIGKTNLDQFATGLVGTRSPYGAVRAAHDPELIAGGSSSGSAVAVALGIIDLGIGTDTAGSGRVPAGLNGVVGFKPTRGLVPLTGVVPAARPYDTVTVFTRTLAEALAAVRVMTGPDPLDPQSRTWPSDATLAAPRRTRIAIPDDEALQRCTPLVTAAFRAAVRELSAAGNLVEPIPMEPFLEVAALLYEGALVAERYAAVGDFVREHRDDVDPVVGPIILAGQEWSAPELARDQHRVRELRLAVKPILDTYDALLVPTTTEHPTLQAIAQDPLTINSRMGTFTNFVNLLDLAAIAIPIPGNPVGVTFIGDRFTDQVLLDLSARAMAEELAGTYAPAAQRLVVFGAHRRGQPLEAQLTQRGARFIAQVTTAPRYRMVALPGSPPKPGIVHSAEGESLVGELWGLSNAALGDFLSELPEPMCLGKIELDDGTWATGFHCTAEGARGATDITHHRDWLEYLRHTGT